MNGTIWAKPVAKLNDPEVVKAALEKYKAADDSTRLSLSPLVKLDQPKARWAAVREAYLLLFYHWGYWFLRKEWAGELQALLKEAFPRPGSTSKTSILHDGSVITALNVKYPVDSTKGEFVTARTPRGQPCWLVPLLVGDRWVVVPSPSDDPSSKCFALWDEIAEITAKGQPLTNCVKVVVNGDVKIASAFKLIEHENPGQTPDFWLEVIPDTVAD